MSSLLSDAEIQDLKKVAITNFAVAVLAECAERAGCEGKPITDDEDGVIDCYLRLSDVEKAINKHLNEQLN